MHGSRRLTQGIATCFPKTTSAESQKSSAISWPLRLRVQTERTATPEGIHLDIYHGGKDDKFVGITGSGSSDDWVTVTLPFDTRENPKLANSRIMLIMNNMSGTVWFRNATTEIFGEAEVSIGTYFLVGKKKVSGPILKLR